MDKITEIYPLLYLGNAKNVFQETDKFKELQIDIVINCCDEIVYESKEKYLLEQFPIDDDGVNGSFIKYLDEIVDLIYHYLSNNKKIYIHCAQGISRSASIIIYYMMKYEQISFDRAYSKLYVMRSCISPNINFVKELKKRDIYWSSEDSFFKNKFSNM